jgi:hypothetical protein
MKKCKDLPSLFAGSLEGIKQLTSIALPARFRVEARVAEVWIGCTRVFMRSQTPDVEACIRELLICRRVAARQVELLRTLIADQLDPLTLAKYNDHIMRWSRILAALSLEMLGRRNVEELRRAVEMVEVLSS